jgi:hypothetical protein
LKQDPAQGGAVGRDGDHERDGQASACGQAMTSTVMVRTTACSGLPSIDHPTAVMAAEPSANQNSQAARSASRWARDDEFCASLTNR